MTSSPSEADPPLVRLAGVGRRYRSGGVETHALRSIHLTVERGEYVAVEGPSGCGKSTLLSILGLLDAPTAGAYWLNGVPAGSLTGDARARLRNREIGFVFQAFNLIGDLTVRENVALPLVYRGLADDEREARTAEALERVGMLGHADRYPAWLSGGQQQRVAVARAIAGRPPLLLADEPTGNLDSANGEAVMALLAELHAEGATLCVVTHDPRYAARAERTVHLLDGRVVGDERHAPARAGRG